MKIRLKLYKNNARVKKWMNKLYCNKKMLQSKAIKIKLSNQKTNCNNHNVRLTMAISKQARLKCNQISQSLKNN